MENKAWKNDNMLLKYKEADRTRFIKSNNNLSTDEQNEIIDTFKKYPTIDKDIKWGSKEVNSWKYNNFKPYLDKAGKSKNNAKKAGLSGLVEGKDYVVLENHLPDWIAYQPLTHLGSKILASNKVEPKIYPESTVMDWSKEEDAGGAKWCISMNSSMYWDRYIDSNIKFIFIFNNRSKSDNSKKIAIAFYPNGKREIFYANDKKGRASNKINIDSLERKLQDYPAPDYVSSGLLVLNSQTHRYDCKNPEEIKIKHLVKNGKFILPLGFWNGNFSCANIQLTSLEGSPQKVGGYFYCADNKLSSLEGSPQEVGRYFDCSKNKLVSLDGAPKEVGGSFYCCSCELTSLEGSPLKVGGDFDCSKNKLVSLDGAPKEVGGSFYFYDNPVYPFE